MTQWARRLRPRFQAGLLGLIRGEGGDRGLHAAGRSREPHGIGRDDGAGVPALVGHRRAARRAAGRRPRGERHRQAPARPRGPRAEAPLHGGRAGLRRQPADRAAQQPAVLRRARDGERRPHRRGAALVPPRRAAADRRIGRAGARVAVGAVRAPDAHGGRGDQGGPRPRQGRARPLHAQGRPAGGARAAGRPAEEDRRHARRARPRLGARAGAGRARAPRRHHRAPRAGRAGHADRDRRDADRRRGRPRRRARAADHAARARPRRGRRRTRTSARSPRRCCASAS